MNPYKEQGYENRAAYLAGLAEEYGAEAVYALADVFGPTEDFDGLVTALGAVQDTHIIAPGIRSVSTASHGGILLDAARQAKMPAYMRSASWTGPGAYEEDCDWCMPALVFAAEFRADDLKAGDAERADRRAAAAESTLRNWHPECWELFYGRTLKPGESMKRDEAASKAANAGNFVTVAAWGDWHKSVPAGMVAVAACKGGRTDSGQYAGPLHYFTVPEAEYEGRREPCGFVVDPARHAEVAAIT